LLGEIIDQYLMQTAESRLELGRVVAEGDPHGVERSAHSIKGASANVGASVLAGICSELEARGRFAQLDGTGELVERFDAEFRRVRAALGAVVAGG
jgi:HPt (histidine-containing phosphotransfer) domain-containing protein